MCLCACITHFRRNHLWSKSLMFSFFSFRLIEFIVTLNCANLGKWNDENITAIVMRYNYIFLNWQMLLMPTHCGMWEGRVSTENRLHFVHFSPQMMMAFVVVDNFNLNSSSPIAGCCETSILPIFPFNANSIMNWTAWRIDKCKVLRNCAIIVVVHLYSSLIFLSPGLTCHVVLMQPMEDVFNFNHFMY